MVTDGVRLCSDVLPAGDNIQCLIELKTYRTPARYERAMYRHVCYVYLVTSTFVECLQVFVAHY